MNGGPELTVAIATLDRPEGLARCLDALAAGLERPAEVIVVDQGTTGTDGACAAARAAGLEVVSVQQERRGLAASRNLALATARCPVVAVTDDDCVPSPLWVTAIRRAFGEDPDLAAVTGRVLPWGPESSDLVAVSSRTDTLRIEHTGRALPWRVGTGANFAVQRDWIDRVGGYDERLGAGTNGQAGEDMDLHRRLLRAGARILYNPDSLIYHQRQPRERRRATRASYGRGMGACLGLWLRGGDPGALRVLAHWLLLRAGQAWSGLRRGEWSALGEELLVLRGTAAGLVYGWQEGHRT